MHERRYPASPFPGDRDRSRLYWDGYDQGRTIARAVGYAGALGWYRRATAALVAHLEWLEREAAYDRAQTERDLAAVRQERQRRLQRPWWAEAGSPWDRY